MVVYGWRVLMHLRGDGVFPFALARLAH